MAQAGKRGRVFYSYLLSFLLIISIPVLMSLFVFRRANTVVTAETERTGVALLETTATYLDSLLEDVNQLTYLVAYNNRIEAMLYDHAPVTGNDYFRAYQLVQDFLGYQQSSTAVPDFYVYLPNLDMVISPTGYFSTDSYYRAMRDQKREEYQSWIDQVESTRRRRSIPGQYARLPLSRVAYIPAIELILPLPIGHSSTMPRGWVVVQIDQRPFRDQFTSTTWEDQSLFLVVDEAGRPISTSHPSIDVSPVLAPYREGLSIPAVAEVQLSGQRFMAFTRQSQGTGFPWTYVALVPGDLYQTEFNELQRYTLVAFILCVLVGGVLIYFIASARYRPIKELLSMLEPEADGTFSLRSDEFAMIRSSLDSTLAEDRLLRQEVAESRGLLFQRLAQQLLKGWISENADTDERLDRMGVSVADPDRWLVGFEPVLVDRSLYPKIASYLQEETAAHWSPQCRLVRDVDGVVCLLFSGSFSDQQPYLQAIGEIKQDIERRFGTACPVGISRIHPRADGLAVLMTEVRAALSYRLVLGETRPIHVNQVLETNSTYYYPIEDENRLINSIISGSYDTAFSILEQVFEANFDQANLSVEMARCLMFDLIATMIKSLESISSSDADAEFWSDIKPIRRLTSCHSLEQLRLEIDSILRSVCTHVNAGRSSHNERLKDEITAIISANLHDGNLGPNSIADALEMNAAYVARVFREVAGVGISQHVKSLRVAEARRLLAQSDLPVREIANKLGFVDSNALIRAFKASEGVTPGEFRETHRSASAFSALNDTDIRN
jgi:two-component system, response regulator YesN